jgi:hypothetical protein
MKIKLNLGKKPSTDSLDGHDAPEAKPGRFSLGNRLSALDFLKKIKFPTFFGKLGKKVVYIAAAAASLLLFIAVPFEQFIDDPSLIMRFHTALIGIAVGMGLMFVISPKVKSAEQVGNYDSPSTEESISVEEEEVQPLTFQQKSAPSSQIEYITILHSCNHSTKLPRKLVEGWISDDSSNIRLDQGVLELPSPCKNCQSRSSQTGVEEEELPDNTIKQNLPQKTKSKKKLLIPAIAAAGLGIVVLLFGSDIAGAISGTIDSVKSKICGMVGGMMPSLPGMGGGSSSGGTSLPGMPGIPNIGGDFSSLCK